MNRRSLLFIPGNSPAMLQNADVFDADAVIIDLEDAVLPSEKDSARQLVSEFLNTYRLENIEIMIRINSMDSDYFMEDLNKIIMPSLHTIVLPKASSKNLEELDQFLNTLEKQKNISKPIGVIALVETCLGILELEKIATCPRVNGILLGGEDLASDLEVERTLLGDEIRYSRERVSMVCKAYKIDAIDTPFTNTLDDEGLKTDSLFSKGLGFTAKACIHPNQVDLVNTIYAPNPQEIKYAKRVLMEVELAKKENKGAFSIDGKMIDEPIIKRAKRILEKAERYGLL